MPTNSDPWQRVQQVRWYMMRCMVKLLSLTLLSVLAVNNALCADSTIGRAYLDVSISLFKENLPPDAKEQKALGIYPEVRRAESRYMPTFLSLRMIQSDQWGAVRITPDQDTNAELSITATIIESSGKVLTLHVVATDSTGRQWINQDYSASPIDGVSLVQSELAQDPYQHLYSELNQHLLNIYNELSAEQITQIKTLALLRYAASIAPDYFADYLQTDETGLTTYERVPSEDDPMLARIKEIRQHEYLFIDVVDEQYQSFYLDIKPIYDMWRTFRQDQGDRVVSYTERQANDDNDYDRGSYYDLREDYDNFRWAKMQDEYLEELTEGFANEVKPSDMALNETIVNLTGTLEQQYEQWQSILRELFQLEFGL